MGLCCLPLVGTLEAQSGARDSAGGPVIHRIKIERSNVYGAEEATSFLPRLVNTFHRTTREWVIRRELLLQEGEPFDQGRAEETARNLRRLGVFRFVRLDTVQTDSGMVLQVHTADAWSTKIGASVRLGSGQFGGTISLTEENLLGTANRASVAVRTDPDRTSIISGFRGSRLIAGKIGLGVQYVQFANRKNGNIVSGSVSQPFYSFATRSAWSFGAESRRQRVLRFFEGESVASDTSQWRLGLVTASVGWALHGDSHGYTRLAVGGQFRREDYGTELEADGGLIPQSHFASFGGALEWRRARFLVSRSFRALDREEDVDLSTSIRAGLWVTPEAFGYDEDGVVPGLTMRTGLALPGGFAYFDLSAYRRLSSATVDSGSVNTALTVFLEPSYRHAMILYTGAGWQRGASPGAEYDLGFDIGPRGYPAHAFTGNRAFFSTAEYRIIIAEEFLKLVGIGVAGFVDYGGAWYAGEPRRTGWDAGVGLRLGVSRTTELDVNRIDLVHCFGGAQSLCANPGGFSLVVAKGFPFSINGRLFR